MSKKISWLILSCSILIFYSCKNKKSSSFHINVTYTNADKLNVASASPATRTMVYLQEVPFGRDQSPIALDSAKLSNASGSFTVSASGKAEGIYELIFGDNVLSVPVINDASEMKVTIDLAKRDDFYKVDGSEASKQMQDLINTMGKKNYEIEKSFAELDSIKRAGGGDSVLIAATKTKNSNIEDMNNYLKGFIDKTSNSTLGVLALGWASRSFSRNDFETSLTNLGKRFPTNVVLQNMKKNFDAQSAQANNDNRQKNDTWIGKQAPPLSLPDVNGKTISLSSFKGKYLLVDFWASWCGPCRMENPNVVKVYNEFKDKNFTILGVSLDKEKEPWRQAIQDDKLTWTHVSDLKYWSSEAVEVFQFDGIPFNILLDPQGKIIAQELRGEGLENKLKEVLK
ncbi:MAG: AhpC/TSA family protein [Bacteroidetes bacterium]|nr:AhpC/TSA family protein [Bacteroidota bacterium]